MNAPFLIAAPDPVVPTGSNTQLIVAALGGIAVIVLLITYFKLHDDSSGRWHREDPVDDVGIAEARQRAPLRIGLVGAGGA